MNKTTTESMLQRKKSKTSLSSLCFLSSSFLFAPQSFSRFLTTKNCPFCCSRFHFKRTHLSSLRAQFRAHTSSRAETSSLLFCVPSILLKSVLREKRERRERVVCGYSCVHHFGEKSTHRRLTNRHLICFFLSPKRIASHPIDRDGGIARSRVASWGRARA